VISRTADAHRLMFAAFLPSRSAGETTCLTAGDLWYLGLGNQG